MENIRVRMYMIPKELKEVWPQNKIVYTIECYTSGRTWNDGIISLSLFLNIGHREYADIMKEKFNCVEYKMKLFYQTKKQCEEAIDFLEPIVIMNKLSKQ